MKLAKHESHHVKPHGIGMRRVGTMQIGLIRSRGQSRGARMGIPRCTVMQRALLSLASLR